MTRSGKTPVALVGSGTVANVVHLPAWKKIGKSR